jgi:hypothetical protein
MELFELHRQDRQLLREFILVMSQTKDAIDAQTAALVDLTTAVNNVPVAGTDPDDAVNAAAIQANTDQITSLTGTLTTDETPPAPAPVPGVATIPDQPPADPPINPDPTPAP